VLYCSSTFKFFMPLSFKNFIFEILIFFLLITPFRHISAQVNASNSTVKIVSSLPRTGSANAQTTSIVNGIKMAISEVGGRVGGFSINYEDWDDASPERGSWDPQVEAANADKAINDPDIMGYLGTYNSGAAKISMPKLNQAGLIMISPGNSWPGLTKSGFGDPNEPKVYRPSGRITYFRVFPTDDLQGPAGARWAKELGVNRVYVLHDKELYGKGLADLFSKTASELGIKIVGFEGIDPKAANYRSLMVKIRSYKPDLIYFGGTTQTNSGQLVKDLKSSGMDKVKIMVPDGCFEQAFITSSGSRNIEKRALITFSGVPAHKLTGAGKEFYLAYSRKYKMEPEAFAVYGYESAKVLLEGIKRAGVKDRLKIIEEVRKIRDFQGALGTWSFNKDGDISLNRISGNTVVGGKFKFLKFIS
jgi:branched-chain amino acid transport system substrate-binding protein